MNPDLATLSFRRVVGRVAATMLVLVPASACAGQPRPIRAPDAVPAPVLAFPGAEGAGRHALGGRGGRVIRVTTLDDSGPGSLRAAVEAEGPRTVVFDIGGTIRLASPLTVRCGRITIAGQTAPGGGITLRDQALVIAADDVVVRYVRSRLGDESGVQSDAVSITRGRRIILDHVSASWSVDETLSIGSRYDPPERGIYDVTVQWSIIAESLNASGHDKGDHGYGTLARGGYGAGISFVRNLWAGHRARMPRPGNYNAATIDPQGPRFEFRGNVFYDWGGGHAGYNADADSVATYAFVGNVYLPGPDSGGRWAFEDSNPLSIAWFEANAMDGTVPSDAWSLVRSDGGPGTRLSLRPDWAQAETLPPEAVLTAVLASAGASHARDTVDTRIVTGVRDRTGRIIDSPAQVGGWPDLEPGTPWIDTDADGLPDAWEVAHALDPHDPTDAAQDPDGDGFTRLEDWLNSLCP